MTEEITSFESWLATPLGQYMLAWEQPILDKAVEDVFGYHALQFGLPMLHALGNSRMTHRWIVLDQVKNNVLPSNEGHQSAHLISAFHALPFPDQSIDLIILPHTLDLSAQPHATLREVERVLVPEGKVIITGINPASLWGLVQYKSHMLRRLWGGTQFLPLNQGYLIGYRRLRDWLQLLNLHTCSGSFGCYRPAFKSQKWLDKTKWMEAAGDRWWPILGATYQITAIKRVQGVRLIGANWKQPKSVKTVVAGARKVNQEKKTQLKLEYHKYLQV